MLRESRQMSISLSPYRGIYEAVVPQEQNLRKIKENIDFSFVNPLLKKQYCQALGRPAKEPEMMFKLMFLDSVYTWRDLPPDYGKWGTVHQRFRRWRDKGIWEKLLELLIDDEDFVWLMIDASHIKVHPHAAGAVGGNQDMERTKGGSTPRYTWPWMRLAVRSECLSQRVPSRIASLERS